MRATVWVEPRVTARRDKIDVQAHCADCPWFRAGRVIGGYAPATIRGTARRHVLISGHMVRTTSTVVHLLERAS